MKRLSIREMRGILGHLDELVQGEGEILITRRGVPIARLLPVNTRQTRPSHADLRARMPRLETSSEDLVRADREDR